MKQSLLRRLLGPSRREVWREVAARLHGTVVPGGLLAEDRIVVDVIDRQITLETFDTGEIVATSVRSAFLNRNDMALSLRRRGFITRRLRWLEQRTVPTGHTQFDRRWALRSNQPEVARALLDGTTRALLDRQPRGAVVIRDDEGLFGQRYGRDVDIVSYDAEETLKDLPRLLDAFRLIGRVIDQLEDRDDGHLLAEIDARIAGQPPTGADAMIGRLGAELDRALSFYAQRVERVGDDFVVGVALDELRGLDEMEESVIRLSIPTLPRWRSTLRAQLALPPGDAEVPLGGVDRHRAVVVWRPAVLDVSAAVPADLVVRLSLELLDGWRRAVRQRLGLLSGQ